MPYTELLMADTQGSCLASFKDAVLRMTGYMPCGVHRPMDTALGYTGQRHERSTLVILLGSGYRGYSPYLMRFLSPDNLSPFGLGGINGYGYCNGEPVNYTDPAGHGRKNWFISEREYSKTPGAINKRQRYADNPGRQWEIGKRWRTKFREKYGVDDATVRNYLINVDGGLAQFRGIVDSLSLSGSIKNAEVSLALFSEAAPRVREAIERYRLDDYNMFVEMTKIRSQLVSERVPLDEVYETSSLRAGDDSSPGPANL